MSVAGTEDLLLEPIVLRNLRSIELVLYGAEQLGGILDEGTAQLITICARELMNQPEEE